MKDLMGRAIWDYFHGENPQDIQTETSISDLDELPIAYLFRSFNEMNAIERKALELSTGSILDVGAGAGGHSLYLQNERNKEVTALDISPKAIEICKKRGIKNTICTPILDYYGQTFDTILLLMNGTGIFECLTKIDVYFHKLSALLNPYGQILIDGTDILYMYDRDEDGGVFIPAEAYYGELDYIVHYKGETEEPIKWLYLDFETLRNVAVHHGFLVEKLIQEQDSYLARLTRINP
ncbi:methyltransferase domain-containing protein [Elizabethkingia argentiflava]|uniref:Methyltransferase domain-containing protein n=1 Tax=Elizabethkingia argenteiflava TaxID=2681556 RepID=A0A845PWD6_9FLAO|nr:class I SAM-dependent methyltransferase [Elizabethkingia argenteiflava]NAW52154.1 methyltransferase domain-containing protein [Elizabethkingia argenteiflava]